VPEWAVERARRAGSRLAVGGRGAAEVTQKIALALDLSSDILNLMSGITFMTGSRFTKTAAVIDLRRHRRLWEDFSDTLLAESGAHDPRESLDDVKRRLKLAKAHG
jgi:hypothetical protein